MLLQCLQEINLEKSNNTKQKTLRYTLECIYRDEMHAHVVREYENFGKRLEMEKTLALFRF